MAENDSAVNVAEETDEGTSGETTAKSRTKRHIITAPEAECWVKDGVLYRKDRFGNWRPDLMSFH